MEFHLLKLCVNSLSYHPNYIYSWFIKGLFFKTKIHIFLTFILSNTGINATTFKNFFMFLPYLAPGGDTFIPLLFLDQLLSADFFSNFFGGENLHQSGYFDTLPRTLNLMKVGL